MSFEGFFQILCKNGHYEERDIYDHSHGSYKCPICGAGVQWANIVNQTNVEEVGRVALKLTERFTSCACPTCDGHGRLTVPIYEIPEDSHV